MSSRTRIIIPVKELGKAKATFAEILSDELRRELVLSMLEDMLNAIQRVETVEAVVVAPDKEVENFAKNLKTDVVLEPGVGLNRALEMAIGESIDLNFSQILILPADLPLIEPEDINSILDLVSGDRAVVITPSKENGTNALLVKPPDLMNLQFGGESFPDHVEEARSRGVKPRIYRSENIERDIDKPPHLLKLETLGKGTKTHLFLNNLKQS